jgi:cytochrome P450
MSEVGFADTDELGSCHPRIPEHSLLLAIIERAVLDYVGPADTPMQHRRSAAIFFRSPSQRVYSFNWILRHLPWEPEWARARVMAYIHNAIQARRNVALLKDDGEPRSTTGDRDSGQSTGVKQDD